MTEAAALRSALIRNIGRHAEKTFDWDAFPGSRGFAKLQRAQMRYIGGGGSPKVNDPATLPAGAFTFSLVWKPAGNFAASHTHEVVEHFLILSGVLTVGWVWGDEVIEARLGPGDMVLNAVGRPHGFRNDGVEPVLMQITVGSGKPLPPIYLTHPSKDPEDLAARFGAATPEKVTRLDPESDDPRHRDLAAHVVRRRNLSPVIDPAGFTRVTYIGDAPGAAAPEHYRMDVIDLAAGAGVKPYVRGVEEALFVHDGELAVSWEENGVAVEQVLGARDLLLTPAGRTHAFRNPGLKPVRFSMAVGEPGRETIAFAAA
ncbi:MAG: cupin domain-containing protein [Siculibacillus sp.]|nr:cupin domain-containing protein [Siculibacillus sp.]